MMKIERVGLFITGSDYKNGVEPSHKYKEINKDFIKLHKMAKKKNFNKDVGLFSAEPFDDNKVSLKVVYRNGMYQIDYTDTLLKDIYLKTR